LSSSGLVKKSVIISAVSNSSSNTFVAYLTILLLWKLPNASLSQQMKDEFRERRSFEREGAREAAPFHDREATVRA
jgi:hypothetical protein